MTFNGAMYGQLLKTTAQLRVNNLLANLERSSAKKNSSRSVLFSFQELENLRKRLFCPSACTTVRKEQLGSYWTDFLKICIGDVYLNLSMEFKFG